MGIVPNVALTLTHLGTCGCVLPIEQQAVIETSLPLKQQEAGLHSLRLWGKVATSNGKDYLIAMGLKSPAFIFEKSLREDRKIYYSQDGFKWNDLEPPPSENADRCAKLTGMFTGAPDTVLTYLEPQELPEPPPAPELKEGEEPPPPEPAPEPLEPLPFPFTELQRLTVLVARVSAATAVVPRGAVALDANNVVVGNPSFPGVSQPGKLESYINASSGPDGPSIAADVPGSWAVQYNDFTKVAVVKSLLWPGYFAYHSGATNTYGDLYFGTGAENVDLLFMA